jgi:hypothetical protein
MASHFGLSLLLVVGPVLLAFSLTYQREGGGTMGNSGQGWAARTDTELTQPG